MTVTMTVTMTKNKIQMWSFTHDTPLLGWRTSNSTTPRGGRTCWQFISPTRQPWNIRWGYYPSRSCPYSERMQISQRNQKYWQPHVFFGTRVWVKMPTSTQGNMYKCSERALSNLQRTGLKYSLWTKMQHRFFFVFFIFQYPYNIIKYNIRLKTIYS
jgi:hypothetical protein